MLFFLILFSQTEQSKAEINELFAASTLDIESLYHNLYIISVLDKEDFQLKDKQIAALQKFAPANEKDAFFYTQFVQLSQSPKLKIQNVKK